MEGFDESALAKHVRSVKSGEFMQMGLRRWACDIICVPVVSKDYNNNLYLYYMRYTVLNAYFQERILRNSFRIAWDKQIREKENDQKHYI